MRAFTAVVNPRAGANASEALAPVAALLIDAGSAVTTHRSTSMQNARELAGVAAGRGDVVIAVGGDGMVGAVAGAVSVAGGILGVVAAGRGNDFARQLGLPTAADELARVLLHAEPSAIDVIDAGATVVVGSVYAGIDSVANAIANRSRFVPRGLVYRAAALRAMATWRPVRFDVDVDGERHRFRGYNVVAANSGFYGNGLHIAPDASIDDGLLDIVMFEDMPKRRFASVIGEVGRGRHVERPEVAVLRGNEVRIAADRTVPAYGDGEELTELPVVARVLPGALEVLRPG